MCGFLLSKNDSINNFIKVFLSLVFLMHDSFVISNKKISLSFHDNFRFTLSAEKEKTAHIFWTMISNFGYSELHCYGLFVFITCNLENRTMQKFYIYSISDSALFAKKHYNNCSGLLIPTVTVQTNF